MKTLFSLFFMSLAVNVTLTAQTNNSNATANASTNSKVSTGATNVVKTNATYVETGKDTGQNKNSFQYLVGSQKVDGYAMQVHTYSPSTTIVVTTFSNGRSAPILQMYVNNKVDYIGGTLENSKGKTTTITDITLKEKDSTLIFSVIGKDFTMSFTLSNGAILKEEPNVTVFYTEGVGAWKIFKKK